MRMKYTLMVTYCINIRLFFIYLIPYFKIILCDFFFCVCVRSYRGGYAKSVPVRTGGSEFCLFGAYVLYGWPLQS